MGRPATLCLSLFATQYNLGTIILYAACSMPHDWHSGRGLCDDTIIVCIIIVDRLGCGGGVVAVCVVSYRSCF